MKIFFEDLGLILPTNFRIPRDDFKYYRPVEVKNILGEGERVIAVHYKAWLAKEENFLLEIV